MCPRCFLKVDLCLCSELTCIRSNIQIVIVRHVTEERLTSNTGRLAALMLSNVRIVPYGGAEPFDEGPLCGEYVAAISGCRVRRTAWPASTPGLLDATFREARRMYRKISGWRRSHPHPIHMNNARQDVGDHRGPTAYRPSKPSPQCSPHNSKARNWPSPDDCLRGICARRRHFGRS